MARVRCKVLRSFGEQVVGLMFAQRVDEPLLFVMDEPRRFAIHSMFCPAFDAVFLDERMRVVDTFEVRGLRLWIAPSRACSYLIEARPGFAKGLKEGQAIGVDVDGAWLDIERRR